jgi:hypothetical protein
LANGYIKENISQPVSQYDNCVSLGWFCGTASSLSKLGLRSQSGPFDWYFSHYGAVLNQIENDFQDFMVKDNLEIVDGDTKKFRDIKYGFHYIHDVKEDFESEYELIRNKYFRRVERFRQTIKQPTVFFRCIRDSEEVEYINHNWEYAENLLKKFNEKNHIIYVYRSNLKNLTDKVQSYRLNINQYIGCTYEMRHLFDSSDELLDICSRLISTEKMQKNIEYDNKTNAQKAVAAYINKAIEENIDGIDDVILSSLESSKNEGIYLWGAGTNGRALAKYLGERNVKINGMIDNNISIVKDEEFNAISFENVSDGAKIFITVVKKESNDDIIKQVRCSGHKKTVIVEFQDLFGGDLHNNNI